MVVPTLNLVYGTLNATKTKQKTSRGKMDTFLFLVVLVIVGSHM